LKLLRIQYNYTRGRTTTDFVLELILRRRTAFETASLTYTNETSNREALNTVRRNYWLDRTR